MPLITAIALFLIALITVPFWFSAESPQSPSEFDLSATTSEPDIPLDWDGTQIELDSATDEIQQLESTMHDDELLIEESSPAARSPSEGP